ncbi:hypothetical protein A3I48_03260 [Candidatus Daviesbacteria bacterium RIFCSPLOWO2_02_FULL_36_7]|uniref:FCP1 homology domain-containing protein n=1 Tax=Candidatus Daviesbacteria bacterium RIFCSPLOWO2_02_FULL_36_7 TaxID=1797792 RepID=A0A1F5MFT7_9BACT|nr:MAG: hypothetical protein A3I48_03260 [Candidatus Daviesbacteria bacterium RIFCSPLOWO2_02_FULL_36_7]
MIKTVIFDLDGLIIDSEPIESESLEILLRRYNKIPIYYETGLIHTVGGGGAWYDQLRKKYEIEDSVEIIKRKKRRIYLSLLKNKEFEPAKGFYKLIKTLKKRDIKTALASNRYKIHIKFIIERIGIRTFFDSVVGPNNKLRHKPAPDMHIQVAKRFRIRPDECLVLEDSETGVVAGKAAGMKVIAVPNQYTKNQDLSQADLIVNSLEDIRWSTISKL